ncbi:MAG: hypothetical protein N2109_11435 [Fimbriimonadales bacterium]|nr:hypothetical protein [Fimbriimonadales bacterium]
MRQLLRPFAVYSTWGLHDELGDRVQLTEELAMAALETLRDWRLRLGLRFDVFQLDCFWFDAERGYESFDPAGWPNGPERFLDALREEGLALGLWFSVSGLRLNPPEWEASKDPARGSYSLASGPYRESLARSIRGAVQRWGCRYLKLDFADFYADPLGWGPEEAYRRNLSALLELLGQLRAETPGLYVITHCGFARQSQEPAWGSGRRTMVDPSLLCAVNAVFSGDPHSCPVVATSISRMLDAYQDRQVALMHSEGFPLERVEDHGAFAATTNTALYRGARGFARSHIAQLARGGLRDMFYGDPRLLSEADVRRMAEARSLFFEAYRSGLRTQPLLGGGLDDAPWRGFLTGGGARGLLTLTNTRIARTPLQLAVPNLREARILFHDGTEEPAVQVQPDRLSVELPPEGFLLLGLGEFAHREPLAPPPTEDRVPRDCRLAAAVWRPGPEGLFAELGAPDRPSRLHVAVRVLDCAPSEIEGLPAKIAAQDEHTAQQGLAIHEAVRIRAFDASGAEVPAAELLPGRRVWSGSSWVAATFPWSGPVPHRCGEPHLPGPTPDRRGARPSLSRLFCLGGSGEHPALRFLGKHSERRTVHGL